MRDFRGFLKVFLTVLVIAAFSLNQFSPKPVLASTSSCSSLLNTSDSSLDASQLSQKITCLQQQQTQNKQQLNQSQQQAASLQTEISNINANISDTNNQISNTTAQISATNDIIAGLNTNITQAQSQLDGLNAQLKTAYQQLYELSQTSTTDLLFQGASINTLLSQNQYIESLQTNLQANITKANQLKSNLQSQLSDSQKQQANLQSLNSQLQQTQSSLNYQVNQKNSLLSQTQGQEANYQQIITNLSSQIGVVEAEYSARLSASGGHGEGISPEGTGGYPYAGDTAGAVYNGDGSISYYSAADPWGFYIRQCTSFGAWKLNNFTDGSKSIFGYGNGNAYNWPNLATAQGFQTSHTPKANVLISWYGNLPSYMPFGHIAWVDSVNSNGTINVEEYNWAYPLAYDTRTNVNPSNYGSYIYIYP